MNKIPFDKKYLTIGLYALAVIIVAITYEKAIGNFYGIGIFIVNLFGTIISVLSPFLYGLLIAYLLNPGVKAIENKLLCRIKYLKGKRKITRPVSIITVYVIVIGVIAWIITYLVPEIAASVQSAVQSSIAYINENSTNFYKEDGIIYSILNSFNEAFSTNYTVDYVINLITDPILTAVSYIPTAVNTILSGTIKAAYMALDIILGMIIAFYMLFQKESYAELITKIIYLIFRRPVAEKIIKVASVSNLTFEKFFMGKVVDSTIVGCIFFVAAKIVGMPYAILLSLIIGITNMIPYFGPIIGAVPVVLIVFINNPSSLLFLWTALIILVLQQFDGNILGPKILGDSIGLNPMGVIFAVIVGGAMFGPLGMFFGVPVFAVISSAFNAFIDRKYSAKYKPVTEGDE